MAASGPSLGQPAKKGKIIALLIARLQRFAGHAMIDGPQPGRRWQGYAVIIGDRDHRRLPKAIDDSGQVRGIEAIVDRGQMRNAEPVEHWQVQPIDMTVHDIKVGSRFGYRVELHGISGERIRPRSAEAERTRHDGN
jgi:hypothetical protein